MFLRYFTRACNFYTNNEFKLCLLGASAALFIFFVYLPLTIDPALQTFFLKLKKSECIIVESRAKIGLAQCQNWSSCLVGCTISEYTSCFHVKVTVVNNLQNGDDGSCRIEYLS